MSDSLWLHESHQASLSITNSRSSLKLVSNESVMPSSHLILCCPLLLLLPIPPSIRVFSNESALRMRWPKFQFQSFIFSISPSNEHPELVSFRMDWLDFLAVQGTQKSFLQHHSSKASILRPSAFFTVQLLHAYMTTGKTIALIRQTFVGKVMSLLLNMVSRLVMLHECNCVVVWAFFGIVFLWDWNENWAFPVLWPLLSFPNLLAYWVQHFHSIIFQDLKQLKWNSITSTSFVLSDASYRSTWLYTPGCLTLGE